MLKSTDWYKEGAFEKPLVRYRLQFRVLSGLVIGWWPKLRAVPDSKLSTPRIIDFSRITFELAIS